MATKRWCRSRRDRDRWGRDTGICDRSSRRQSGCAQPEPSPALLELGRAPASARRRRRALCAPSLRPAGTAFDDARCFRQRAAVAVAPHWRWV